MINSLFLHKDKLGSLLLLVFALTFLILSYGLDIDPRYGDLFNSGTLPKVLSWGLLGCSAYQLFTPAVGDQFSAEIANWNWLKVSLLIVLMLAYALTFSILGFLLASISFLVLGFRVLGERSFIKSILIAAGVVVPIWLLLVKVFDLFLENGELYYQVIEMVGGAS